MTATEILSAVSELLRALRLGPMELALSVPAETEPDDKNRNSI